MEMVVTEIHHAQVKVREKLAIPEDDWNAASTAICSDGAVAETAVLSTCPRVELSTCLQRNLALTCLKHQLDGNTLAT